MRFWKNKRYRDLSRMGEERREERRKRIEFFVLTVLDILFRLNADTASVTSALGGSCDEASGVCFLENGCSTDSSSGSSFASWEFVAISRGRTAFLIVFLE